MGGPAKAPTAICVWASGVIWFESQRPTRRPRAFNNLTLGSPNTHLGKVGTLQAPHRVNEKTPGEGTKNVEFLAVRETEHFWEVCLGEVVGLGKGWSCEGEAVRSGRSFPNQCEKNREKNLGGRRRAKDMNKTQLVRTTHAKRAWAKNRAKQKHGCSGIWQSGEGPKKKTKCWAVRRRGCVAEGCFCDGEVPRRGSEEAEAEGGAVEDQSRRGVRKLVQRECGHRHVTFCSNPKVAISPQSNF